MVDDGPWLYVPQAVVLEVTGDIERALELTADSPVLLVIKANNLLAFGTEIPLAENADAEQLHDARRRARTAMPVASTYLTAGQRVRGRLVAGVRTKARRRRGGPYESVDPVEYVGAELRGVDAIDKWTRSVMLFDVLINTFDLIENLTGRPIRAAGISPSDALGQVSEHSARAVEKWDCAGDPLPKLIAWARSRWGEDGEKVPNRKALLLIHREQFGRVPGVNEKTMAEVRREVASRKARRGGAPTHRR